MDRLLPLGTTAWDALNENVTQAQSSIPSELFIYASALNRVTEVALSNAALNGTPTTSRAWFYMNTAPGQSVRADVIWGGAVRARAPSPAGRDTSGARSTSPRPTRRR